MASRTAYEFIVDMNKTRAEFVESRRESAKYKKELDDVKRKLDQLEKSERSAASAVDKTNQVVSRGSRTMRIRSDDLVKGARITGGFNNATFQMSNAVQDATIAFGQMGFNLQAVGFAMRGASNNVGSLLSGLGPMAAIGGTVAISLLNLASGMFRGARGAKEMSEETEKLVTALNKQETALRAVQRAEKDRARADREDRRAGMTDAEKEKEDRRRAAVKDPLARAFRRGEFAPHTARRAQQIERDTTVAERGEIAKARADFSATIERGPTFMDQVAERMNRVIMRTQNIPRRLLGATPLRFFGRQRFLGENVRQRAIEEFPVDDVRDAQNRISQARQEARVQARGETRDIMGRGEVPGGRPSPQLRQDMADAIAKAEEKEREKKRKTQADIERDRETIRLRQEMQEWRRDLSRARQGQVGPALGNILPFPTGITEIGKGPFRDTIIDIMQALIENNQAQIQKSQSTEQIEKLNEREVENQ